MRRTPFLLLTTFLLLAGSPAGAMDDWEVRHLLTRTGFGVSLEEYQEFKPLKFEQAVDRILAGTRTAPTIPVADHILNIPEPDREAMKSLPDPERREKRNEFQKLQRQAGQDLKAWWYQEMLATDSPLTERMTLFWSNHFTSSLQKVKDPNIIYQQNALLRREALGNFRTMTHAIVRDPAMLIYLDNQSNRKGKPNENFARELMELFTLGIGNYTEQDIKEAARALTGWSYNRRDGKAVFNPRLHDAGEKTLLGKTGAFGADDVVEILLEQQQTARFITEKLWKEFVSPTPDEKEVERLAALFRKNDYEIKPLLRAMFLSKAFRSPANQGTLVKSPVDLLVGAARTFGAPIEEPLVLVRSGKQLNQDLFDPPNVKGWPGGESWINSNTLLQRQQVLGALIKGPDPDRREMRKGPNRPQRKTAGVKGKKNPDMPTRLEALREISAKEQLLLKRIGELRRQGLQRAAIVSQLQKEGHSVTEVRSAMDSRRAAVAKSGGGPVASAAGDAEMMTAGNTMMEESPPMRPMTPNAVMPRADVDGWMSKVGESKGAQADQTVAALLVPTVPAQTRVEIGQPVPVRELLLDPVYQLK